MKELFKNQFKSLLDFPRGSTKESRLLEKNACGLPVSQSSEHSLTSLISRLSKLRIEMYSDSLKARESGNTLSRSTSASHWQSRSWRCQVPWNGRIHFPLFVGRKAGPCQRELKWVGEHSHTNKIFHLFWKPSTLIETLKILFLDDSRERMLMFCQKPRRPRHPRETGAGARFLNRIKQPEFISTLGSVASGDGGGLAQSFSFSLGIAYSHLPLGPPIPFGRSFKEPRAREDLQRRNKERTAHQDHDGLPRATYIPPLLPILTPLTWRSNKLLLGTCILCFMLLAVSYYFHVSSEALRLRVDNVPISSEGSSFWCHFRHYVSPCSICFIHVVVLSQQMGCKPFNRSSPPSGQPSPRPNKTSHMAKGLEVLPKNGGHSRKHHQIFNLSHFKTSLAVGPGLIVTHSYVDQSCHMKKSVLMQASALIFLLGCTRGHSHCHGHFWSTLPSLGPLFLLFLAMDCWCAVRGCLSSQLSSPIAQSSP